MLRVLVLRLRFMSMNGSVRDGVRVRLFFFLLAQSTTITLHLVTSLTRNNTPTIIFDLQHQRSNTGTWTHEDVLKLLRKGNPCDAMWNGSFYHSFMFDSLITKVNKKNWTVSVLYVLCSSVDRISLWRDKKSTLEHTLTFKHQQVQ